MTEPQVGGTYEELLAVARWAEDRGLSTFARSDHYYSSREPRPDATDAFATLAGLARDTSSIRLCVLVSPLTFRHPAVIAKTAATIDQMSGGRLDLGVGTGWMELEHEVFGLPFPEWPERFARLTETLAYLEAAFGDGQGTFDGDYYQLDADVQPKPTGTRIIVGGSGPKKTPTLAGQHADEYNHFTAPPADLEPKIATMRAAAEAAGRDPSEIVVSVMGPALVGSDESSYQAKLQSAADGRDMEPAALEQRFAELGFPIGSADQAQATVAGLEAVGVDRIYVQQIELTEFDDMADTFTALGG